MGLALSIPVIVLCYVEYGSITVWAYPFLLMFVALVSTGVSCWATSRFLPC